MYPGPYRCWYRTPTAAKVAAAHKHVLSFVERREGGFDVVMGFSQVRVVLVCRISKERGK